MVMFDRGQQMADVYFGKGSYQNPVLKREPASTELAFNDSEPHLLERIKLENLGPNCCHWPYGDPIRGSISMCGRRALSGKSYCPEHYKRAYRESNAKLRGE